MPTPVLGYAATSPTADVEVIRRQEIPAASERLLKSDVKYRFVSLRGCEAQLKGHIEGNLQMGNDRARLLDVLTQLLPYIGYPRTLNALRCPDEVAPAPRPNA